MSLRGAIVNIDLQAAGKPALSGYLTGLARQPAIILLSEWWGLNEQIKGLSDRFAEHGFQVLAPDLYHGKVAKDATEANHLMSSLDFQAAVAEVKIWAEYLKREKEAPKIGVTGFCMGGALTVASASKLSQSNLVSAGSVFYGIPNAKYFPRNTIACPILLHFGEKDTSKGFSDPETAKELEKELKDVGVDVHLELYEGADHAFMNERRPEVYNEQVAKVAFGKTIEFFNKHLK